MAEKPKILITGFSHFPGEPENTSQYLIELFNDRKDEIAGQMDVHAETIRTQYSTVRQHLSVLVRDIRPDIALHFGLSRKARGFCLEQYAHNRVAPDREDDAGQGPQNDVIDPDGPHKIATGLPVNQIYAALRALGLPVERSDDAGDYVCNYLFYLIRSDAIERFMPKMSGFIHVPLLDTQTKDTELTTLTEDQLWRGTREIIKTCTANQR
jgi:pyroglutamyl-peptidase